MKTLIIHPEDSSTTFLEPIYSTVMDKTIIKGGITRAVLMELIHSHNRIMMMGHGSPWGLLSAGRFPGAGMYIIDDTVVPLLKEKSNNVYIWCYANIFVEENNLEGFYSGMFISEVREANAMGLKNVSQYLVDQSNFIFSNIASNFINENAQVLYNNVRRKYSMIVRENKVAQYNYERLYFYIHPRMKQI